MAATRAREHELRVAAIRSRGMAGGEPASHEWLVHDLLVQAAAVASVAVEECKHLLALCRELASRCEIDLEPDPE